ncbi:MAG TPA: Lrp/AsnC ligand binding domain-containing protein [Candidatus Competibacteraceae bacterium]|nr:Lrp/AsnC ligand binding domain-containing protein [Candidatus Competibacteraceae bacterium]
MVGDGKNRAAKNPKASNGVRRGLDRIDCKILDVLQRQGRISNVELAKQVNLSPTPCLERVRRLERDGYILGYHARLDPAKLGASLLLFVQVTLDRTTPDVFERFREEVQIIPEVMECYMVAGGFDYLLKIRIADMDSYRNVLGQMLTALPGIMQTHTYVVMENVKDTLVLPLDTD